MACHTASPTRARPSAEERCPDPSGVQSHEDLTIAQNIFLGHEKQKGLFLDDRTMNAAAKAAMQRVGLHADPRNESQEADRRREAAGRDRQGRVAQCPACWSSMADGDLERPTETERLFALIAQLKARGRDDHLHLAQARRGGTRATDEIVVVRDGRFVARAPTAETPRQQMANLMVGRDVRHVPAEGSPARRRSNLQSRPSRCPAGRRRT